MSEQFSLASYRSLLGALENRGYEARGYLDADTEKRHLILRHDIDMSLEAAVPLAELESALGIRAHYFILVRTEMYNLFSAASRKTLRALTALGHHIGLHLDASICNNDLAELQKAAVDESAVLEIAAESKVAVISFHRPVQKLLGYSDLLGGRHHAYQPRYFSEMGYCSDSRGRWGHGHPLDHPAVRSGRALQLLTHPIWWTSDNAESTQSRLDRFIYERYRFLRKELAANCDVFESDKSSFDPAV
jgi:hypothetical protein